MKGPTEMKGKNALIITTLNVIIDKELKLQIKILFFIKN